MNDSELLEKFRKSNDQDAFRQLIQKHSGMVISICRRDLGNESLAQDAAQTVFIILAQNAKRVKAKALSSFLFNTSRLVVKNMKRVEARRKKHEAEAAEMKEKMDISPEIEAQWEEIKPFLNDAVAALGENQKEAVIRYFLENKSQNRVAHELGCSEDAVKMRVSRGIKKLKSRLAKKGIVLPGAVLSGLLASKGAEAASAPLAEACLSASMAALAGNTAGIGSLITIAQGATHMMMWMKIKMAAVCLCGLAAVGGLTTIAAQHGANDTHSETEVIKGHTDNIQKDTLEVSLKVASTDSSIRNKDLDPERSKDNFPKSMKGYFLFGFRQNDTYIFYLRFGTNWIPPYDRIIKEGKIEEGNSIKAVGIDAAKELIKKIPPDTNLYPPSFNVILPPGVIQVPKQVYEEVMQEYNNRKKAGISSEKKARTGIIFSLDIKNRYTEPVRVVPFHPSMITFKGPTGRDIKMKFMGREQPGMLKPADFPVIRPGAFHTLQFGGNLTDKRIMWTMDRTGGYWNSTSPLSENEYTVSVSYNNTDRDLPEVVKRRDNNPIQILWTGSVASNTVTVTIGNSSPIAWGKPVNGLQAGLVPLGGDAGKGWTQDFRCPKCRQIEFAYKVQKCRACGHNFHLPYCDSCKAALRVCQVCGKSKPWSPAFIEGEPMCFEIHLKNVGIKKITAKNTDHMRSWKLIFTPKHKGIPRIAAPLPLTASAPRNMRPLEIAKNRQWAAAFTFGGNGWRFEHYSTGRRRATAAPIKQLKPGIYTVTAQYTSYDAPGSGIWTGTIMTAPFEIEIVNAEDKELAEFLKKVRYARVAGIGVAQKDSFDPTRPKHGRGEAGISEILAVDWSKARLLYGNLDEFGGRRDLVMVLLLAPGQRQPSFRKGDKAIFCWKKWHGNPSAIKWSPDREKAVRFALAPGWKWDSGHFLCPWCCTGSGGRIGEDRGGTCETCGEKTLSDAYRLCPACASPAGKCQHCKRTVGPATPGVALSLDVVGPDYWARRTQRELEDIKAKRIRITSGQVPALWLTVNDKTPGRKIPELMCGNNRIHGTSLFFIIEKSDSNEPSIAFLQDNRKPAETLLTPLTGRHCEKLIMNSRDAARFLRDSGIYTIRAAAGRLVSNPVTVQVKEFGLRLHISAESLTVEKGKSPEIKATITNMGTKPVTLVQPGDGSMCEWRTPVIAWSVLRAEEKRDRPKLPQQLPAAVARCGNINALRDKEVFTLKPNGTKELGSWVTAPSFPSIGKYRIVFHYSNKPGLQWKGIPLGKHDEAAMRKVKTSTECNLVSNELLFTVVQPNNKSVNGLTFTIESDKTKLAMTPRLLFRAGPDTPRYNVEQTRIKLSFKNVSSKPIRLNTYDCIWSHMSLHIAGPDKESVSMKKYFVERKMAAPEKENFPLLQPGEIYNYSYKIPFPGRFGNKSYNLLKSGAYRLSITYSVHGAKWSFNNKEIKKLQNECWKGKVTSNEIIFKCLPPEGRKLDLSLKISPVKWNNGTKASLTCTVRNVSNKPLRILAWGVGLSNTLQITDSKGVIVRKDGGRDATRALTEDDYPLIKPQTEKKFTVSGTVTKIQNKNNLYRFLIPEGSGGIIYWELQGGHTYSARAVLQINDIRSYGLHYRIKEEKDALWTGKIYSNPVSITVSGKQKKPDDIF